MKGSVAKLSLCLFAWWLGLAPALPRTLALGPSRAHAQEREEVRPLYPGPVPTSWPSVARYEAYAAARAELLAQRQRALLMAGRPAHYQLKHSTLLAAFCIGAAVAVGGFIALWTHTGNVSADRDTVSHTAFGAMLAGAGLAVVGGFGARTIKNKNRFTDEIDHLRDEQTYWTEEVERVKHERARERASYELSLRGLGVRVRF